MDFNQVLKEKKDHVEKYLNSFFNEGKNKFEAHIEEAMKYSLMVGGKRLRPILLLEMAKAFDLKEEEVIDFACAIEMIHNYSLVHDDLPAMDNDDFRRNKPTNHKVYGEAMAILAGDGLLTAAFQVMLKRSVKDFNPGYIKALYAVSIAAGHQGMIGGQVADMACENKIGNKEDLTYIHEHKTGQLLAVPLVAAGHIAQADEKVIDKLHELGLIIGLVFQITDDLLDIEGDQEKLGKPIGSDEKNHKMTYPSLYGLETSKIKVQELLMQAETLLADLPVACEFLNDFLIYLKNRQY